MTDHSNCSYEWQNVTCDRCGRVYQCTPSDDFYCTPEGDHCCESCLTGGSEVVVVDPSWGAA